MHLHRILNDLEPIVGKNLQITRYPNALTNAIYQLTTRQSRWALRRNNPDADSLGIDRDRETAILNALQHAPFTPVIDDITEAYLLTRWIDGEAVNITNAGDLQKLMSLVHKVHACATKSFDHTPLIDIRTQLGHLSSELSLPPEVERRLNQLKARYQPAEQRCLCHHDWHSGNVIETNEELILIDWEYAALGDSLIDWACLYSGFNVPDHLKELLLDAAGLDAGTFNLALALVEILSLLWFDRRFPKTDWRRQYAQWLHKWRHLN